MLITQCILTALHQPEHLAMMTMNNRARLIQISRVYERERARAIKRQRKVQVVRLKKISPQ